MPSRPAVTAMLVSRPCHMSSDRSCLPLRTHVLIVVQLWGTFESPGGLIKLVSDSNGLGGAGDFALLTSSQVCHGWSGLRLWEPLL